MLGLNDQVSGHWVTANSSVISVDTLSGMAEAVGEGTTHGNGQKILNILHCAELVFTTFKYPLSGSYLNILHFAELVFTTLSIPFLVPIH